MLLFCSLSSLSRLLRQPRVEFPEEVLEYVFPDEEFKYTFQKKFLDACLEKFLGRFPEKLFRWPSDSDFQREVDELVVRFVHDWLHHVMWLKLKLYRYFCFWDPVFLGKDPGGDQSSEVRKQQWHHVR